MSANLIDDLATKEPPQLDFTPRPGTLSVAEVTSKVTTWCTGKALSADRQALLLALALLYHDHEAAAHELCQAREGQSDADLIHAILHRREGDAGNAGYWFRKVGRHALYPQLATVAQRHGVPLAKPEFDPLAVVAAVQAGKANPSSSNRLRAYQSDEFRHVADHLAGTVSKT